MRIVTTLGLALGLALAAGALLWLGADGPREAPADVGSRASNGGPPPENPPAETRTESAHGASGSRRDAPLAPLPAGEDAGPELRWIALVAAEDGRPLPEASAWVWPRRDGAENLDDLESWLRDGRLEAHRSEALELRADVRGRVGVPAADPFLARGFFLVAESAAAWGQAAYPGRASGDDPPLRLFADAEVHVRVQDAQGRPCSDVPVVLRQRQLRSTHDRLLTRTDADGLAVLRHAGWLRSTLGGAGDGLVVAVPGLFEPPVERPLPAGPPVAGEALELRLPPSGSCEVTVVDGDGRRLGGALEARLSLVGGDSAFRPVEVLSARSGSALRLEQVQVGRDLDVQVVFEGAAEPLRTQAVGPRRAGECVRVTLRLEEGPPRLQGRLLDPGGAPLGDRLLRASLEGLADDGTRELGPVRSAGDGSFSLEGGPGGETPPGARLVLRLLDPDGNAVASVHRELPPLLLPGANELGDLRLIPALPLASGIVVDDQQRPFAGAQVVVQPSVDLPPGSWPAPVLSDAQGRFVLRGEAREALQLLARAPGRCSEASPVLSAGAQDVRLVLRPEASLAGHVLLDPALRPLVRVLAAGSGSGTRAEAGLEPDGAFRLAGPGPGEYDVRVVLALSGEELARVDGVVLTAGETRRDARLDPLDLRAALQLAELEVVDGEGRTVPALRASARPAGDSTAAWTSVARDGSRLCLVLRGRPVDVSLVAPGFRLAELRGVSASQRVVLRPAGRLRFFLSGTPPAPPLRLGLELAPLEPTPPGTRRALLAYFDARGELTCESPFEGALRARLVLSGSGPDAPLVPLEGAPLELVAPAGEAEARYEVRLDAAQLEGARRALGERD